MDHSAILAYRIRKGKEKMIQHQSVRTQRKGKVRAKNRRTIPVGVEPTIFCLGGRRVSIAPRDQPNKEKQKDIKSRKGKKAKASAGIEPTTFPLLGERTADYAKRPIKDK